MIRERYVGLVVIVGLLVFAGSAIAGDVGSNSTAAIYGRGMDTLTATNAGDQVWLLSGDELRLAQQDCARRVGPFATQDTAWRRWREARSQGYAVSNGVVPCYDGYGTRGYCFNVFVC
jgi:hypothetical protein